MLIEEQLLPLLFYEFACRRRAGKYKLIKSLEWSLVNYCTRKITSHRVVESWREKLTLSLKIYSVPPTRIQRFWWRLLLSALVDLSNARHWQTSCFCFAGDLISGQIALGQESSRLAAHAESV